jgi:hypothetical protein
VNFASENAYYLDRFNHAAAICGHAGGVLIAFYTGLAECHDSQRVCIFWQHPNGDTSSKALELEPFTGNPVLFNWGTSTYIIYSKFEAFPSNRGEWWQYCSLWQRQVRFVNGYVGLEVGEPTRIIVSDAEDGPPIGLGFLARCNPIKVGDELILPLYREHQKCYGAIIKGSGDPLKWAMVSGTLGSGNPPAIQPTLWHRDGTIYGLLRNFTFHGLGRRALQTQSTDGGQTWTPLSPRQEFFNANNSLILLDIGEDYAPAVVWNNDPAGRRNLVLGTFKGDVLYPLDYHGSYPAYTIQGDKVHILYSFREPEGQPRMDLRFPGQYMVIKHKTFSLKHLRAQIGSPFKPELGKYII